MIGGRILLPGMREKERSFSLGGKFLLVVRVGGLIPFPERVYGGRILLPGRMDGGRILFPARQVGEGTFSLEGICDEERIFLPGMVDGRRNLLHVRVAGERSLFLGGWETLPGMGQREGSFSLGKVMEKDPFSLNFE